MCQLFLGSLVVQTDATKMYLLENNIATLDFKSHIALMMVILLLYSQYFLYPTYRATAPLLFYSCSAVNFWSVS